MDQAMRGRLETFVRRWVNEQRATSYGDPFPWRHRTAGEIARELLSDAEFQQIRLATILGSPDGQLISAVVAQVLPWPQGQEFALLVAAIKAAAMEQQRGDQRGAAVMTLVAVGVVVTIAASIWTYAKGARGA